MMRLQNFKFVRSHGIEPEHFGGRKLILICAVRRDELGQSSLFDLGPLIGIGSDASIQHFQVEQGWDMSIFLCVATKASATTSNLIIVKPFGPKVLKPGETLGVVPSKETIGTVQRIHMVSMPDPRIPHFGHTTQ